MAETHWSQLHHLSCTTGCATGCATSFSTVHNGEGGEKSRVKFERLTNSLEPIRRVISWILVRVKLHNWENGGSRKSHDFLRKGKGKGKGHLKGEFLVGRSDGLYSGANCQIQLGISLLK